MHIIQPINEITLIAINLIQNGNPDAARQHLDKAFELNPAYPNTYYAFALLAEAEHNFKEAFEMAIVALFKNPAKDLLYQQSLKTAMKSANEIIDEEVGGDIVNAFASTLEEECGKKIIIEEDAELKTAVIIELAENHDRTYHLVKYNSEFPSVYHLIMHELTHLLFAVQARQAGKNKLFVIDSTLFEGLSGQMYNTPIDLSIEDYLFQNYPDLMPYQFLSLLGLVQEGIHATTDEQILTIAPPTILSKSKTLHLVNAFHLLKRYGVNLIEEHRPTTSEREQAEKFYREYEECRANHTPGDEYELLQSWAKQLGLQNYFAIQPADKKMRSFPEAHQGKDINMAVTRFMVEALQYFKNQNDSRINEIAIQIGLMCGDGITPDAEGYTVPLIAGKTFTGYQVLAYSYVSWAKAFPEYLQQLQIPFEKEYEFAFEMVGMGGN
ncbi:MAG: hypothetical protein WCL42_09245 [Chlorobiaceae bacterium]